MYDVVTDVDQIYFILVLVPVPADLLGLRPCMFTQTLWPLVELGWGWPDSVRYVVVCLYWALGTQASHQVGSHMPHVHICTTAPRLVTKSITALAISTIYIFLCLTFTKYADVSSPVPHIHLYVATLTLPGHPQ